MLTLMRSSTSRLAAPDKAQDRNRQEVFPHRVQPTLGQMGEARQSLSPALPSIFTFLPCSDGIDESGCWLSCRGSVWVPSHSQARE